MKRFCLLVVCIFLTLISWPMTSYATNRYAVCDACGYCPKIEGDVCSPTQPDPLDPTKTINLFPGDWSRCVTCLYPVLYPSGTTPNPASCDTVKIDPATNELIHKPSRGRHFTLFGCVDATGGFAINRANPQGGAPSLVQVLLNVIFSIGGGLALIYLLYGAYVILTSQADPERLNYGKRIVYGAIVGVIFTLSSVFLINLIGSGILKIPGMRTP